MRTAVLALLIPLATPTLASAGDDPPLAEYFLKEVERIDSKPLLGIDSAESWKARRPELQRQLLDMLGLWPLPEKADLQARITGTVERQDFIVERLVFQSRPGLYVTGNLYRPKRVEGKLPAILYVCGHARVEKAGVIYGNKVHYQNHAAWYAANGYVCLVIDTLQLGEVPGLHHGTYSEGMWWWLIRGYTPAGVEAWNGVRAIDYLLTRPEVDPRRIGVTGRSGGGASSWWIGAIDDRVAAVVPVAGITDLRDHVVGGDFPGPYQGGVVDGHCDCMYFVNTYRWNFDTLAALVAPKPLLVENTDADPIFPEGGVRRIYEQLERVYGWHDSGDRLGLMLGRGGHDDTEEVRHASFAFMERWLKGRVCEAAKIEEPDRSVPVVDLKVLPPGDEPADARNAGIHEDFVARAGMPDVPATEAEWGRLRDGWVEKLGSRTFAAWPESIDVDPLHLELESDAIRSGLRARLYRFDSQPGVRLPLWMFTLPGDDRVEEAIVFVLSAGDWQQLREWLVSDDAEAEPPLLLGSMRRVDKERRSFVLVAPRGVGPTAWPPELDTQIRRRFYLLGQTVAGMQAWDARRAMHAFRSIEGVELRRLGLAGRDESAGPALFAATFEPDVTEVLLHGLNQRLDEWPEFLNLSQFLDGSQALALAFPRPTALGGVEPSDWGWAIELGRNLNRPWLRLSRAMPVAPADQP